MRIEVPLVVIGGGPAALIAAKVSAGAGVPCLLAGHHVVGDDAPVPLEPDAVAALRRHRLFDILRPYFDPSVPPTITTRSFEEVIKQHCVADLNVIVYDAVAVIERRAVGAGLRAVLTDGTSRWELAADRFLDGDGLPRDLCTAITTGVRMALRATSRAPR